MSEERKIILRDADGSRCGMLSEVECEQLVKAGKGYAVRSRKGEIKKFVCYPRSRIYLSGANQTTQSIRADGAGKAAAGQALGDRRLFREHKKLEKA